MSQSSQSSPAAACIILISYFPIWNKADRLWDTLSKKKDLLTLLFACFLAKHLLDLSDQSASVLNALKIRHSLYICSMLYVNFSLIIGFIARWKSSFEGKLWKPSYPERGSSAQSLEKQQRPLKQKWSWYSQQQTVRHFGKPVHSILWNP